MVEIKKEGVKISENKTLILIKIEKENLFDCFQIQFFENADKKKHLSNKNSNSFFGFK